MGKLKMMRTLMGWAVRFGGPSAVTAVSEAVPRVSQRTETQVFRVTLPVTVYVRGSGCRVSVQRHAAPKVIVQAAMQAAFGLELVGEQDDAGVYIVARRKPIMGQLSRADFSIVVPYDASLVFHLTPGDVVVEDVDGMLELPPVAAPEA
ncbi:MAG TPA: hypothetical protein PKD09_02130 [Aggregatilinea sp.]|jgi:hypothetical protein|uniref:hypothetical protein n=1 Tax=Aggregatilinea sp. TaxID=2806333 RepID=UPI002CFF6702|nr:hypothetical protein [Aggregatilinea sp.]HML20416.1 hypothetical protein [Aggregatilinea sp.]